MGLAIAGMHYVGVEATIFTLHAEPHPFAALGVGKARLGYAVAIITFFILFLALIAGLYDRRFALLAEQESEALRESEARFRLLYRNTPLPLHSLDVDGVIEQVSEAWLALLGYERHEVVGRPLVAFMCRDSAQRWVTVDFVELAAGTPLRDAEYQFEHRSGRALDVLMSASVDRGVSGRVVRILCGLVDITARKAAEAALRQAHKMETVGQLTGGIAHDFNNLLTVVIGNLEGAQRAAQTGLFVKAQRNIDAALHGAMRAAGVTDRLLAFSRPQPLQPKRIDVNGLIGGMSELFRRTLGRSVSVGMELDDALWPVRADANQLESALLNLAINSRDAMPNGGPITIRTANVHVQDGGSGHGLPAGDYASIAVADRGSGIPEDIAEKVFEPFFTTKGEGQGTGLGLAMVQGFARHAGGDVRIVSSPGEGTTVTIYLPRAAEERPREGATPEIAAKPGGELAATQH
jgi:PAS domain S-box-containing protein